MAAWQKGFSELTKKTHKEQAKWWLNGFWEDGAQGYAEEVWKVTHKFIELDTGRPVMYGSRQVEIKENSDLDEFKAHQALEAFGETMTVQQLRKHLSALDIDKNNRLALSEYLLNKYKKTPQVLVDSPQGTIKKEEMDAAQAQLDDAQRALDAALEGAEAAAVALRASEAALRASEEAQQRADDAAATCRELEAPLKKANEELEGVVAEINALEQARAQKIAELDAVIASNPGAVKKGKAVQEKEQLLAEDPLPLRKAKITQAAALKRVEKARAPFKAATDAAEEEAARAAAAKEEAAKRKREAQEAQEAAEQAKAAAVQAFQAAQEFLDALTAKGGTPHGAVWWMNRELAEKKKFMPK